jgi:hypothetical protein
MIQPPPYGTFLTNKFLVEQRLSRLEVISYQASIKLTILGWKRQGFEMVG